MDISVMLSTFRRSKVLEITLESFCIMQTGSLRWEILLVDNADDHETYQACQKFQGRLPLKYMIERRQGKNSGLNKAIQGAQGELFIFTDDDVIVQPDWLMEIWRGTRRWPKDGLFGGRIVPQWPEGRPPFEDIKKDFFCSSYSIADWDSPEGPYDAGKVWGPNVAIRKHIFNQGYRFNPHVGPSGQNYIMGSETELTRRLQKDGFRAIYLPKAVVRHYIRPEQMTERWLYGRAFRYGRQEAMNEPPNGYPIFLGAPRYLYRIILRLLLKKFKTALQGNRQEKVTNSVEYWIRRGQLYQYRLMHHEKQG